MLPSYRTVVRCCLFVVTLFVAVVGVVSAQGKRRSHRKQVTPPRVVSVKATSVPVCVVTNGAKYISSSGYYETLEVTRKFYQTHRDEYDFIVIFKARLPGPPLVEDFLPTKNTVSDIGSELFDQTALAGSSGRLRGVIRMDGIEAYDENEYLPLYRTLTHELGHAWGVNPLTLPSGESLNYGAHFWDGLQNDGRCNGLMQDNPILDHRDGTYSLLYYDGLPSCVGKFHPFSLYLMGLLQPEQVQKRYLFVTDFSQLLGSVPYFEQGRRVGFAVRYKSTARTVGIEDVIAAAGGPRVPSAAESESQFRVGFVLLTPGSAGATDAELEKLSTIAYKLPIYWAKATEGRSRLRFAPR